MIEYLATIGFMLCIYAILVVSANLAVGMPKMLNLCQASFFGVGAYAGSILLGLGSMPFSLVAVSVMLVTGLSSLPVSLVSARLKGDFFILATMAFQMIIFNVLNNWTAVTGGSGGYDLKAPIQFLGKWRLPGSSAYFFLALALLLLTVAVFFLLQRSPYGRLLRSVREGEIPAKALGKDILLLKVRTFFISAAFSGLAGVVFASKQASIHPISFNLEQSILIITALFIGGAGKRLRGPLLGALFICIPEGLRWIPTTMDKAGYVCQIIYGSIILAVAFLRPQGLAGQEN